MSNRTGETAVIYCRVSSPKQKAEGHGLESQESRCREYAGSKGYLVEAVFPDDVTGEGDFMKRPGMVALLSYLDAQPDKHYVVIFDDLKRFARDTEFHIQLRKAFRKRGARMECLNFKVEDTPEGEFIETIMAAQGELERKQNRRQVIQKMQARVMAGYWCFSPVAGYRFEKVAGHGKMLVRDEPLATIVTDVLQGVASGRFEGIAEVKRFLEDQVSYPRDRNGEVHFQRVHDLLTQPLYAGYMNVAKWGLDLHPGKHVPLVDFATWSKVQDRLNGNAKAPTRKDISGDFPLRGFILCGCCDKPMTAAWAKGRSERYGYYYCQTKSCGAFRKSIRRESVEGDFSSLLQEMQPSRDLFLIVYAMFEDVWEHFHTLARQNAADAKAQLLLIERKAEQLMDRLAATDSDTLVTAYENQIKKLEREKRLLAEKVTPAKRTEGTFRDTYRTAMEFLANPLKLWGSERLEDKRLVLRMAFADKLAYVKNEGYRTADMALPFKALAAISSGGSEMVGPAGLEPATKRL